MINQNKSATVSITTQSIPQATTGIFDVSAFDQALFDNPTGIITQEKTSTVSLTTMNKS